MIKKKEEQIARLTEQLNSAKVEHAKSLNEIIELQSDIDTLMAELDAEKGDRAQDIAARVKVQEELDELRTLLETKTSEETRRNEVEKSKEEELADLRSQVNKLNHDLADARHTAIDGQSKLKRELEHSVQAHASLQQDHKALVEKEIAAQTQLNKAQTTLSELEKAKRAMESELQNLRSRQHDNESQLAEVSKTKEVSCSPIYLPLLAYDFTPRVWSAS